MQISDVWNAADDCLAVELEHQAKNAVSGRMLRTKIDQHVIGGELRLDRFRRRDRETPSVITCYQRNALWTPLRV